MALSSTASGGQTPPLSITESGSISHLVQQQQEQMTMLTTRMARTRTAAAPAEATTGIRGKVSASSGVVAPVGVVASVGGGPTGSRGEGKSNL